MASGSALRGENTVEEGRSALNGYPITVAPPLPATVRSRDRQDFRPTDLVWELRKHGPRGGWLRFNWAHPAFEAFSPRALHLAKLIVASRLPVQATGTAHGDYSMLRRFARWLDRRGFEWQQLDYDTASAFLRFGIDHSAIAGDDFARLRDLYRYGATALDCPDFSRGLVLELSTVRAPGSAKGSAVRQGHPTKGQLTADELDAVLEGLIARRGTPEQRATVWLALELGRNVSQFVQILNGDLVRERVEANRDPSSRYRLAVPRHKKGDVERVTEAWPVSPALGDLLWSLVRGSSDSPLLWWVAHRRQPEGAISEVMQAWVKAAGVRSPRTGKPLHLNARRFRVTLLTDAADAGASPELLAMLAGHSDLQNVRVYVETSASFLPRVAAKVDEAYAPMVKRFRGELVSEEETRRRGLPVIPGFAPQLPTLMLPGIGGCGSTAQCKLAPPLTCYPCPSFIAFADANHRAVQRALEERIANAPSSELDAALEAVRDVVRLQNEQRAAQTGMNR